MLSFYNGKKVLITGHTGFKGSWLCQMLLEAGAEVSGYAMEPQTTPSLFTLGELESKIDSVKGDIRDLEHLKKTFDRIRPEIVIHMAAQPLVRESYNNPVYTYDVNIMGTVNVMECIRCTDFVRSVINVTTDKVYKNKEWVWGYREDEELNGFDPYSNSKSCSELVTSSYYNSFLKDKNIAVTTVRAGNVIGGGDYANDRIMPDCIRAASDNEDIIVRNPYSIRPYQHVLEPLTAYLLIAEAQYKDKTLAGNYNVGPNESDCLTTGELVGLFCQNWKNIKGREVKWVNRHDGGPHEAGILRLDCSKIKQTLGWKPVWNAQEAVKKIVEWQDMFDSEGRADICMATQIREYMKNFEN